MILALSSATAETAAMGWVSGQAYSDDVRARVLGAADRGGRAYEIASQLEVSAAYIDKALACRKRHGLSTALPRLGRPGRKRDKHLEAPGAHVLTHRDATLEELVAWVKRERSIMVCVATMWTTLDALGLSVKKKTCHTVEQERADVAAARAAWRASQGSLNVERLDFSDETRHLTPGPRRS